MFTFTTPCGGQDTYSTPPPFPSLSVGVEEGGTSVDVDPLRSELPLDTVETTPRHHRLGVSSLVGHRDGTWGDGERWETGPVREVDPRESGKGRSSRTVRTSGPGPGTSPGVGSVSLREGDRRDRKRGRYDGTMDPDKEQSSSSPSRRTRSPVRPKQMERGHDWTRSTPVL